jgi:tetratricopeptide (TPR) repeat protein
LEGDVSRSRKKNEAAAPPPGPGVGRQTPEGGVAAGGIAALALFAVVFCLYLPAARNDFVNYDDPDYVTANRHVLTGLRWENVVWAFGAGHASNWHPLTWLSHMADAQIFGEAAWGHHLTSVFLHAFNTGLVFLVLRRMTGARWKSWVAALVFGVHPLHVESVTWVSERKDVLSGIFFLLMLAVYAGYTARADRREKGRSAWPWYFGVLVLFAFGLMSKPMLVTAPFLLCLVDLWPLERVKCWNSWTRQNREPSVEIPGRRVRDLVLEKIPFLLLSAGSCVATFLVQKEGGAVSVALTLSERIQNALVSYVRYLGKMCWPMDLSVLYPHPGKWALWKVAGSLGLITLITVGVLRAAGRRPWLPVGWAWFLGMLVPVIGIIQVGIQSMADRYMYLPMIGLLVAVVWGAMELASLRPAWARLLKVAGCLCVVGFIAITVQQISYWHDSETLFLRAVRVTDRNYLAYNNLGFFKSNQGKVEEAMEFYRKSLEINPAYEDALNNMGFAFAARQQHAEALGYYEAALKVRPGHVEVHNNLGNALSELGRIDEAIGHYEFVLKQKPDHADAHNNLGIALAMKGRLEEAIPHFQQAIQYRPNYASAHSNLGNAYAAQRRFDEAVREYKECLRLKPTDPQAHNNLGNVLVQQGRLNEAVGNYRKALALNAENPEAHFNLGLVLAQQGNREEAVGHFREALRQRPNYPEAQRELEILLKAGGK